MRKKDKIKGIVLFILGAAWLILVYCFDDLVGRPKEFGSKAVLGFIAGVVAIVNSIRIYRRK